MTFCHTLIYYLLVLNCHILRYCQATYDSVCNNHLLYSGINEHFSPEAFTKAAYDTFADTAEEQGGGPHTSGVKGHCVLNSLNSFHCMNGTPPCLGHDFFEGNCWYNWQTLENGDPDWFFMQTQRKDVLTSLALPQIGLNKSSTSLIHLGLCYTKFSFKLFGFVLYHHWGNEYSFKALPKWSQFSNSHLSNNSHPRGG